jgi:hypothetical protein
MQNCAKCGFRKWLKPADDEARYAWNDGHRVRNWICGRCGQMQAELPPHIAREPKILYLDIETSLIKTMSWSLKVSSKYINPALLISDFFVITWAASWVGERKVYSGAVTGRQAKKANDKQCLRELWKLIDDADLIAGHNSDSFDLKKLNTRFLLNGYGKPRTYRTLDTLKMARKYFAFQSNKLEHISLQLGFNPKKDMELSDWIKICLEGDEERITKMQHYNEGDVREGKKVLERFLPWVHPFPIQPRGGYKVMNEKLQTKG